MRDDASRPRLDANGLAIDGGRRVSLHLTAGECLGLTGSSGSGKTRLLRALADLDPVAGALHLAGEPREDLSGPDWRQRVMLVPAESYWWADRVIDHFPSPPGEDELAALAIEPDFLERAPSDVSSGERQRLALLRAVVRRPRFLLLDEPTANLDAANADRVEAWLMDRCRQAGAGLLWVSHDLAQLARVADRALQLDSTGLREYQP
jgi:ABC-type dipeptide/oligopeptide/nickel transport system ATPase subunit